MVINRIICHSTTKNISEPSAIATTNGDVVVMVIALIMAVAPVVSAKIQLDNYADELVREAEISGRIGSETTARAQVLTERTGIAPIQS